MTFAVNEGRMQFWRDTMRPARTIRQELQRTQEVQYFLLLRLVEVEEVLLHGGGFAATARMGLNRREQVRGAAIVQKKDSLPEAPQGSGTELVAASATLRDVIRQGVAHVMHFNIRVRRNRSTAQRTSNL